MDEDDFDEEELDEFEKAALEKKTTSQLNKKGRKNTALLPRGKQGLSFDGYSAAIAKAGFDPSKVQAKAKMLQAAISEQRKRKRDEEEDVDMEAGDDAEDGMDVDGGASHSKRSKGASGAVINRRAPRTNRQLAGMKTEVQASKADQLRNLAQRPRNMLAKAGESDRAIRVKMVNFFLSISFGVVVLICFFLPAETFVCGETQGRQDRSEVISRWLLYLLYYERSRRGIIMLPALPII